MSSGWVSEGVTSSFIHLLKSCICGNRSCCVHVLCLVPSAGLDKIYELTNTPTHYELRFDLGLGPDRAYAVYDNFKIAPVKQKFKLTIGKYSGTAGGPSAIRSVPNLNRQPKTAEDNRFAFFRMKRAAENRQG